MKRKYVHRKCGLCPKFRAGWCAVFAKVVNATAYRCSYGARLLHAASRDAEKERARKRSYTQTHKAERAAYDREYRKAHRAQINAYQREWYAKQEGK